MLVLEVFQDHKITKSKILMILTQTNIKIMLVRVRVRGELVRIA